MRKDGNTEGRSVYLPLHVQCEQRTPKGFCLFEKMYRKITPFDQIHAVYISIALLSVQAFIRLYK